MSFSAGRSARRCGTGRPARSWGPCRRAEPVNRKRARPGGVGGESWSQAAGRGKGHSADLQHRSGCWRASTRRPGAGGQPARLRGPGAALVTRGTGRPSRRPGAVQAGVWRGANAPTITRSAPVLDSSVRVPLAGARLVSRARADRLARGLRTARLSNPQRAGAGAVAVDSRSWSLTVIARWTRLSPLRVGQGRGRTRRRNSRSSKQNKPTGTSRPGRRRACAAGHYLGERMQFPGCEVIIQDRLAGAQPGGKGRHHVGNRVETRSSRRLPGHCAVRLGPHGVSSRGSVAHWPPRRHRVASASRWASMARTGLPGRTRSARPR